MNTNLNLQRERVFRVEAGYDANGNLVVNILSLDPTSDPTTTPSDEFQVMRCAGGQLTLFAKDGTPLTVPLYEGQPLPNPLELLGLSPGSSVLNGIIVQDIFQYAQEHQATVLTLEGQTVSSSDPPPSTVQLSASVQASGGGSTLWTCQQEQDYWKLVALGYTLSMDNIEASGFLQISNINWHRNSTADAARESQGSTIQSPPADWTWEPTTPELFSPDNSIARIDPECQFSGTGQNMVFQHGSFSSCSTWNRMHPWLGDKFQFGNVFIPSLSSTDRLPHQAGDLINLVAASGKNYFLVVGHSQGGLIARDVAQQRPDLFGRGVITVNTPNSGALLAKTSREKAAEGLADVINSLARRAGCTSASTNVGCLIAFLVARLSFPMVNFAFDELIPASGDLVPDNPYLLGLNLNSESFTRVGVVGLANKRWVLMRLGGDAFCNPESSCGGRRIVSITSFAYGAFRTCEVLALIFGDIHLAIFCARVADGMDAIDGFWNRLTTTRLDGKDGIVQASAQFYLGLIGGDRVVLNADSHVGATRSDRTRAALERALEIPFQVRPKNCSFSISPSTASFSQTGGSGSFSVSTTTGCSWSAVSGADWVTITSGATGGGSGTVAFSVEQNLSPLPRSGGITISPSGPSFVISQAGASTCTYSLSPTGALLSSNGGSGTVAVSTQPGCVWSAATTDPWILITDGATGTGSGSFIYSVEPNPLSTSRTGKITVVDKSFGVFQQAGESDPKCLTRDCTYLPSTAKEGESSPRVAG